MRIGPASSSDSSWSKRLIIYFYTSNQIKFQQALLIFDRRGLGLRHFRGRAKPYLEDHTASKSQLLELGLEEVIRQTGSSSLVFVEDTSIRIDALSSEDQDVPGLRAKEWMNAMTFKKVDAALQGKSRSATVSSDIALHIPGLARPIFFHGETAGVVAAKEPNFPENPRFPWLSPNTFNGWFIPEGADRPLGAMDLEESLKFDFRGESLGALADTLEHYTAILNLPGQAYLVRRPLHKEKAPQLFSTGSRGLLVIGRICAGKTTMGQHLARKHSFLHVEASEIMLSIAQERQELRGATPYVAAATLLTELGFEAIANNIIDRFGDRLNDDFVITGFRTLEEIEIFRKVFPSVQVIVVQAPEETRFSRYLVRPRGGDPSLAAFRHQEMQQANFGLQRVVDHVADIGIRNVGTLDDFYYQIDSLLLNRLEAGVSRTRVGKSWAQESQLYRCLTILAGVGGSLSPTEIEERGVSSGIAMSRSTARKVLGSVPGLVERESLSGQTRYRLNERGAAYLRVIEAMP